MDKNNKVVIKIRKRDGRLVPFDKEKIVAVIHKAGRATGEFGKEKAERLAASVVRVLNKKYDGLKIPTVEEVQNVVEEILMKKGLYKTARAYIAYRKKHAKLRRVKLLLGETTNLIKDYIKQSDWRVKENANMAYSLQGLNNHIASSIIARYWLQEIYPSQAAQAHIDGDLHLHDLGFLGAYCVGWDFYDLLKEGFKGVPGKIQSRPAKHFRVALGQAVNFLYTMQGEAAGAQALSNFDTLLAPFIAYDRLDYPAVKQAMQEFVYNMNVPTRVGFQCISEDTEILTPEGWKNYQEVKKGNLIKTFNLRTQEIEDKKVTSVFKRTYHGWMYNLRNRIQDQLISPQHRVVRRKFQTTDKYVLEPIEDVARLKSSFIIPIAGKNVNKKAKISDEQIKLMAWIIAEGSLERPGKNYRSCYRVSIYQSKVKNYQYYREIKSLLDHFNFKYSEYETSSLGDNVTRFRLNALNSKKIHQWFGTRENVHFVPDILLNLSQEQSRLFIETYLKADGTESCKISTINPELLEDLQRVIVNCGYGFTVLKRSPTIGKKEIYVLRIIKHKETYIQKIEKVKYKGVIWCPHTKNGTIIARRKGKVFITGNSPFTNLTFDLTVPPDFSDQTVIVGGKPQKRKYKEFQKEMDMLNRAFAEVMLEGDAKGRVFTFPIPTYSLTKDFDWDNPTLEPIFEMSAKYGIPYWANFVNSDMKPEETRSMCCRLRLNLTELIKRGGGFFGANALTGSIGVVTLNMARIGYLSKSKKSFLNRVGRLMDVAKESLEVKRKVVERFTEKGLYPYSKFYLRGNKKRLGGYWSGHFSTIGLLGLNEGLLNFMKKDIGSRRGQRFAEEVLIYMRNKLVEYQKETGDLYNLEATPAEGSLAPGEKVLLSQSDPKFVAIGPLIDRYLEENREKVVLIGNSEVLKLLEEKMFTWGFNRETLKMKKYPVTALVRHPGKSMYEIETISGRKVKVTGQHSIFTLGFDGAPREVLVADLKMNDFVAIPKKIEMEEIHREFNLIELFKDSSLINDLYGVFPSNFIEELVIRPEVKKWSASFYRFAWKDVGYMWKKNKTIPLKLVSDLRIKIKKEVLTHSKIFYRKSKNSKAINALIPIDKRFGFIIGALLAEGWLGKRMEFTNTDKDFSQEFFQSVLKLFGRGSAYLSLKKRKSPRKGQYPVCLGKMASLFLEKIGLVGKSDQKKIPNFLFFSSSDCIKALLRGFYLGDGSFWRDKKKNDVSIRLYSNSEELIEGLNLLLLRLGVLTKIREEEKRKKSWQTNFVLSISGAENLEKFFRLVLDKKLKIGKVHSGREIIPYVPVLIKSIMQKYSIRPVDIGIWKDSLNKNVRQGRMSVRYFRRVVKRLSRLVDDEKLGKLKRLANSDFYWDKVKKIKKLTPFQYVYDLEVDVDGEKVNNFLGGRGLVCLHNTAYRLAKIDKKKYPDIIVANEKQVKKGAAPFYTNSSQLPVDFDGDVFEALKLQDPLQTKYTGGCIEKGNKVLTDRGLLRIENIVGNFKELKPIRVLSYNLGKKISQWDEVVDAVKVDVKKHDKIRIRGERGLDITTSDWHPFFILQKMRFSGHCPICGQKMRNIKVLANHLRWRLKCREKYQKMEKYQVVEKRADELEIGDYILQNSTNLYFDGRGQLDNDLMWLVGFFIGDGAISGYIDNRGGHSLRKYRLRFFSSQRSALEKVSKILRCHFQTKVKVIKNDQRSRFLREVATGKQKVIDFFFGLGFKNGKKVYDVAVPQKVKENLNQNNIFSFISGLMDSDGHFDKRDGSFEYYTVSESLADDLLEIVSRAGLMVSKSRKKTKRKNEVDIYRLRIPAYQITAIKDKLEITVNSRRIKQIISKRKKRHLPVVRVKEVSKVEVEDNQFYDLTTKKNHNYLAGKNSLVFIHNTVFHTYLGERLESGEEAKVLAKKIVENFGLPYFSFTPTFSVCPQHGYLKGEYFQCPKCGADCEVYSRVVGYLRPVSQWNKGKKAEFEVRKSFKTR